MQWESFRINIEIRKDLFWRSEKNPYSHSKTTIKIKERILGLKLIGWLK